MTGQRQRCPAPGAAHVLRLGAALLVVLAVVGCGATTPSGGASGAAGASGPPAITETPSGAPSSPTASPAAATSAPTNAQGPTIALATVAAGLDQPLDLATRPDDPSALFVVEQVGRIRVIRDGALAPDPVLDISGIVTAGGEQGLLGLAFHPDPGDDRLFVYYTALDGRQILAAYRTDQANRDRALPDSGTVLLAMDDPFPNHNGGGLAFGPDGYLYIATGDGGAAGDPLGSGRRLDTLLAKILRIDVDVAASDGRPYGIPSDNPYRETAGARPEVFLTGLRNPWRIRFDRLTGDLWIGDVGQSAWEEVDRAPAGEGGLDFGWNIREGLHCYAAGPDGCDPAGLTPPVAEYGHDQGCAITGGAVYRGDVEQDLSGRYVFADYCSGRFWTIDASAAADGYQEPAVALDSGRTISAIAEGTAGELYATDLGRGEVLRITSSGR